MNNAPHAVSIAEMTLLASLGNPQTCQAPSLGSDIQNTLVPPLTYQTAHLEAHGQSFPKDDVGGDLVDLLADGRDVIAYVADVSGHGLRAGVLMGMIKTAVRYGLLLRQPVAKLLGDINRVLPAIKQPNMFATLAALRFDGSNEVEYISAGHVPLLHYRHRNKDVVRYSASQFPLGLIAGADYLTQRIPCEAGDIFAVVTDGVVEVGPDQDAELGFERLAQILHQSPTRPLSEIVDAVYSDLRLHGPQQDDQTILLVRAFDPNPPQTNYRDCENNKSVDSADPLEAKWQQLLDDLAAELARD
jgi:sigma-B regulation protein RsbU (phosphoserine phosphatase)